MATASEKPPDRSTVFIYRASIKLPSGKVIYARSYGLKAFRIPVKADNDNDNDKRSE
jgi:hypothetical protein